MTAKELRIGNLVLDGDEPIKMDIASLRYMVDNKGIEIFRPIPLTEEWLLKLGFRRSSNALMFLPMPKIQAELHYEKNKYGNVIVIKSSYGELVPDDIYHVHQLQNLYFALTGEELNLQS